MIIPFLKTGSRAESTFRIFICNAALILSLICIFHGVYGAICKSSFKEDILKDAFSVQKVSKLPAYYYEDFFREYERL